MTTVETRRPTRFKLPGAAIAAPAALAALMSTASPTLARAAALEAMPTPAPVATPLRLPTEAAIRSAVPHVPVGLPDLAPGWLELAIKIGTLAAGAAAVALGLSPAARASVRAFFGKAGRAVKAVAEKPIAAASHAAHVVGEGARRVGRSAMSVGRRLKRVGLKAARQVAFVALIAFTAMTGIDLVGIHVHVLSIAMGIASVTLTGFLWRTRAIARAR